MATGSPYDRWKLSASLSDAIFVAAYGDCAPGYICTEEAFIEGGYYMKLNDLIAADPELAEAREGVPLDSGRRLAPAAVERVRGADQATQHDEQGREAGDPRGSSEGLLHVLEHAIDALLEDDLLTLNDDQPLGVVRMPEPLEVEAVPGFTRRGGLCRGARARARRTAAPPRPPGRVSTSKPEFGVPTRAAGRCTSPGCSPSSARTPSSTARV